MMSSDSEQNSRRILGRVPSNQFVGRLAELQQLVAHPSRTSEIRGLLLLLAPSAGISELLRQAYDVLFNRHGEIIPIYFAFTRNESTAVSAAIEFLNTFLQQYIAYRRDEPALCQASLTFTDLVQLAPTSDYEWIRRLVDSYNLQRFNNDDRALVRFCLSAPQRVPLRSGRPFVMLDGMQLAEQINGSVSLGKEVIRTFTRGSVSFAFAGLRRQILNAAIAAGSDFETLDTLRINALNDEEARLLVEHVAHRQQVTTTEVTRDLMVQQFECSPVLITSFLQSARDRNASLTSYLACQQLYADELMGGRLNRHFSALLENLSATAETRRALIGILYEAVVGEERRASLETWRLRLNIEQSELNVILRGLHEQELINWDATFVETAGGPRSWRDFLKVRYRLEILNEPRALVMADTISDALKRAPHTMARHYRRTSGLALRPLVASFNGQRVPRTLFNYSRFSKDYKAVAVNEIVSALETEAELIRLPQAIHVAAADAFDFGFKQLCDTDHCLVAHSFEGGTYNDVNQVIWLVAEIDSKLEADGQQARMWVDRLRELSGKCSFGGIQIWLICREGFTVDAGRLLESANVYFSSRQQVELLASKLTEASASPILSSNEVTMVLPMSEDSELIAANTAEQIARRLNFRPEAINQIKTAVVEACINASEHSFSPDRKIYQRFLVEDDRLVVIISSRGVIVPANPDKVNTSQGVEPGSDPTAQERRGWGLKLIRTLMDEVEFESVDEGTSLRMTKYLRNGTS